jgi:hypothetical protein
MLVFSRYFRFVVDKWYCDRFFSQYFGFSPSVSFRQFSTLIFTYTLLLTASVV